MKLLGHAAGFLALVLFIISYQLREKRTLLAVQTAATALMCAQFFFLGATSGFALNIICIIRNAVYFFRDRTGRRGKAVPVIMAAVMAAVSLYTWEGPRTLLIASGLMINTVCMGLLDNQGLRKSVILTCTLTTCYNIIERAPFGALNEGLSVISAAVGVFRMRKGRGAAEGEKK